MKIKRCWVLLMLVTFSAMAAARITDQEYWSPLAKITAANGTETIRLRNAHDQDSSIIKKNGSSKEMTSIDSDNSVFSGTNYVGNAFWLVTTTNTVRYGEHIGAENGLPPRFCITVLNSEGKILEFAATTNTIEDISSGANTSGVYMRFRSSGVPTYFTYVIFSQLGPCIKNSEMFIPLGLSTVDSFYMTEEDVGKTELAALVDGNGDLAKRLSMYYVVCEGNIPMEMAWLHIGAMLGNDVCRHNLAFLKEEEGATEKAMFHFPPEEVEGFTQRVDKNPDDLVAVFFLFKHYESSGDSEHASKYADLLRKKKANKCPLDTIK